MAAGWIMMVVFWGLVVVGIVVLVRAATTRGAPGQPTPADAPLEILKRRYAAGELTKEQFEEMKHHIA